MIRAAALLLWYIVSRLEVAQAVCKECSIYVNDGAVRVQALSPTLLRVEPRGPQGFEDRPTFAIVNRSFPGIKIWKESEDDFEVVVATDYYKVHIQRNVGIYWHVTDLKDEELFRAMSIGEAPHLLNWPAPLTSSSYGFIDSPRFVVPDWGPAPAPDDVDPELRATNGFDFRNNGFLDTYVILMGSTLDTWSAARKEFLDLTGPVPLLPNYAFGTWFTRWYNYTQQEAMDEVLNWTKLKLPLDVWGLDMNWRNTTSKDNNLKSTQLDYSDGSDWYYDREDTTLFPKFSAWFKFLQSQKLRTYHNDHPYPVASRGAGGLQTSPEEVKFRWEGLTRWLKLGLSFWWFDRNWRFSIPPPFLNISRTGGVWEGLDNSVWGSFIYHSTAKIFGEREHKNEPPMSLTKFAPPDWRPNLPDEQMREHIAHHRFPVWWTGDGVPLQASVRSMVDSGIYGFKPYVHSDCGQGFADRDANKYMRWIAHCAFGTIVRIHGEDDLPWVYNDHVTEVVRTYLDLRYKMIPSIVAAGRRATATGFPLVARGDFYWPEHQESKTNDQYIFLDDMLVAPIWDTDQNVTKRSVWIPPGTWEDAWDGSTVTGPTTKQVWLPLERQPMWHRRGGFLILARHAGLRVAEQNWSSLVIEAFTPAPSDGLITTRRQVYEADYSDTHTVVAMSSASDSVNITVFPPVGQSTAELSAAKKEWLVRLHLLPGQRAKSAHIDGGAAKPCPSSVCKHIFSSGNVAFVPLGGPGAPPAPQAGPIVEIKLEARPTVRTLRVALTNDNVLAEDQLSEWARTVV